MGPAIAAAASLAAAQIGGHGVSELVVHGPQVIMLALALDVAVPAWAWQLAHTDTTTAAGMAARDAEILEAEALLLRVDGSAHVTPAGFTALARSVAYLALHKPGGVDLLGRHWEYSALTDDPRELDPMDLHTLTVDRAEAEAKVAEYAGLLTEERTAEDDAIGAAYRAAARGLPIIRLSLTVAAGGFFDDTGLPKIAVARATSRECSVTWDSTDVVFYGDNTGRGWDGRSYNRGALVGRNSVRCSIPADNAPERRRRHGYWSMPTTLVPHVPPRYRPRPRNLRHRHILWEVEKWELQPPRDPALLRHIRGDLWVVQATWDLTDLERYVLTR